METAAIFPWNSVRKLITIIAMLALGVIANVRAQTVDPRIGGTTYVIAFPDTVGNTYDVRQDSDPRFTRRDPQTDSVFVTIYSPTDNVVNITGNGGYATRTLMKAGEITTVWLNGNPRAATPICNDIGGISSKTFRLTATDPVVLYCFIGTKFGSEAFTPIPVEQWGTSYYAAALRGEVLYDETAGTSTSYGSSPKGGPSEILIIAANDNTNVTITPNGRLLRDMSTTVTLMKDQCYQVQSYVNLADSLGPQYDLGGSHITADKPIGVISGNTRSQVIDNRGGLLKNAFKNMMIEWLAPIELHGTEFVYLPTWDRWRPTGVTGEDPNQIRQAEIVRIYGTTSNLPDTVLTDGVEIDGGTGRLHTFQIQAGGFYPNAITVPAPHVFRTDRPAQAFMNTTAVVRFNGTTGTGPTYGSSYDGVATYMAQMMPREYWAYTAPYIAPVHPGNMSHYLSIVTDSASRKKITINGKPATIDRMIVGTDLYWGSQSLTEGEQGVIQGADSSCRFYAVVFGEKIGMEAFRPGKTRKQGDGGATGGTALFSSEYEENIGFMYGYPVATSYRMYIPPPPPVEADSLLIATSTKCGVMTIDVRTVNQHPAGLGSISFMPDSTLMNARLTFVQPAPPDTVNGLDSAKVTVSPIDASKDAQGIVIIRDRTGKIWQVYYSYTPEHLRINPSTVDFGLAEINITKPMKVVITNPMSTPVEISTAELVVRDTSLRIDSIRPAFPAVLAPGDSMTVYLSLTPSVNDKIYQDTLVITRPCGVDRVPIQGATVEPCLYFDDIAFGTTHPGVPIPVEINICNRGGGIVTFHSPGISWNLPEFTLPDSDRQRLIAAVLGAGDCITITVTFRSDSIAVFQDKAQLYASTHECRDISFWTALVTSNAGVAVPGADMSYSFGTIGPNPLSTTATISFTLGSGGPTSVEVFDAIGNRVATLADEQLEAGDHRLTWNTGDLPQGIYYCRIRSGSWATTRPMVLTR